MIQLHAIMLLYSIIWGALATADTSPGLSRRTDILCHKFEPTTNSSEWKDASTPTRRRSDAVDCRNSNYPCGVSPWQPPPERIAWPIQYAADDNNVRLDIKTFNLSAIGGSYAEEVSTVEDITFYVPFGQRGYLGAYANAVLVPGVFGECSDGATYPGEAMVPDAKGVTHVVVMF